MTIPTSGTARKRPTISREEALALAAARKHGRRLRTQRIRRVIAIVASAAFIGPFGVIAAQMAAGGTTTTVAKAATTTTSSPTASPSAVTTRQS